jgi:Predicted membrane protein involved in D-alanine export
MRKYVLLCFSIFFYAAGEPFYIFLILCCIWLTWLLSKRIADSDRMCLIFAIIINLLPLIFFKYAGFIIDNIIVLTGMTVLHIPKIELPVGISFYTFQIIAYVIDLYKGKLVRQKNIAYFTLYIMFFPQLIAGPIVRYQEVDDAIENNRVTWEKIQSGIGRFIVGLSKKVLIANQVGYVATEIMSHPLQSVSTGLLWLAILSFMLQIYFDFSGYSDMAIGLGGIFGFTFPENFRKPYMSTSVTDFWRRWHITLGSFFRDYVYIPLGGNRVSSGRWIINVFIVWFLTGLWHGAAWNFAIWGGVLRGTISI